MGGAIKKLKLYVTIALLSFVFFIPSTANSTNVFVFSNKVGIEDKKLSHSDIEDIFTLRIKRWDNGQPIRVFLLPRTSIVTREFTTKYLNMTASRYYDLIENRESSGKNNIADIVNTEYDILLRVMSTPGGIGYATEAIVINFNGNIVIVK